MNLDVLTIYFDDTNIDSLVIPKGSFNCFVITNKTYPNSNLLKPLEGKVTNINVVGRYAPGWDLLCNLPILPYEIRHKKPPASLIGAIYNSLNSFIDSIVFAHNEFLDDETTTHNPIVLLYDDENLKDYVLERVESILEEQ